MTTAQKTRQHLPLHEYPGNPKHTPPPIRPGRAWRRVTVLTLAAAVLVASGLALVAPRGDGSPQPDARSERETAVPSRTVTPAPAPEAPAPAGIDVTVGATSAPVGSAPASSPALMATADQPAAPSRYCIEVALDAVERGELPASAIDQDEVMMLKWILTGQIPPQSLPTC